MEESKLITEARQFAINAHQGQKRKLRETPYVQHPVNVAAILQKEKYAVEVIAAGLLHDVVEDTHYTINDIRERFGDKVALLVSSNTEDKQLTWEERKAHTISSAKIAAPEVKALIGADKLDNLRSILLEYELQGDSIWTHFKRGKEKQRWYYSGVSEALFENLETEDIPSFFYELRELSQRLK
ncbi:(p)ppGpp synthase/HD superfamily hydrolase [Peribacillus deserti]|uniref:(P)ppGpp synthase/HD superfamily hydrolase n=1 Tax=Peribacillus deserti TaxID=673318 RepID=A0ABS2QN72_9BACI|nr:HD domain-containing protein [Peribacillus deserti]MBM7694622.1 (p)ppGpp synthase/HD superfamily hydrolase [Peribacillus deserti]